MIIVTLAIEERGGRIGWSAQAAGNELGLPAERVKEAGRLIAEAAALAAQEIAAADTEESALGLNRSDILDEARSRIGELKAAAARQEAAG